MMRMSHLVFVAILLGMGGCSHVPQAVPRTTAAATAAEAACEPVEAETLSPAQLVAMAGPDATVVVFEADDLGGGPDAVRATPKRPAMPSMMTGIAVAPSR